MDHNHARKIVVDWTREHYGHFVDAREITAVRKATGRAWAAQLYCTTAAEGDIHVGQLLVSDTGTIAAPLSPDDLINALVNARAHASSPPAAVSSDTEFAGLGDDMDFSSVTGGPTSDLDDDDGALIDSAFDMASPDELQQSANHLISSGETAKMLEARDILPRLLMHQDRRGAVLHQMAELEMLLGELDMGVRHLEAAAREYANLANLNGLEMVTRLASQILPEPIFDASPIKMLFEQVSHKLTPLNDICQAPLFISLGDEEIFAVKGLLNEVTIQRGEIILHEGDVANMAFILKTGVLSIRLESPEGHTKVVRTCFPGDFVGESSVLGAYGATCTATVQGEMESALWQFDGQELRQLCEEYPEIRMRIESAKTLHQLDSFISMNESTATLDTFMRDRLLGCITGIGRVTQGTVLNPKGALPREVHLVVNGRIDYRIADETVREYQADQFAGLRDSLHELPLEGEFIAATDGLLVRFDPDGLRAIATNAPPEVIAVLEKME